MRDDLRLVVVGGLLVAAGLGLFVSPFADSDPDGLSRVAQRQGLSRKESPHAFEDSPVAGYRVEGIEDERLSTAVSAVVGIMVTFGVALVAFGGLRARTRRLRGPSSSSGARS